MRSLGFAPVMPPGIEASRIEILQELWKAAGPESVRTRTITVMRTSAGFDALWAASLMHPNVGALVAAIKSG